MILGKYLALCLVCFSVVKGQAVKFEYADEEYDQTRATIRLSHQDAALTAAQAPQYYNRLGSIILKNHPGSSHIRPIDIKGMTLTNLEFVRNLMRKAYEIATEREVPINLNFYRNDGTIDSTLTTEWQPLGEEIETHFYVNPWSKVLEGSYSDSD